MKCPYCGFEDSRVVESRSTDDGERVRRRRECVNCIRRFTTYEVIESVPVVIIKKDGSRELFDRKKLFRGLLKSCEKRPVCVQDIETTVNDIEIRLQNSLEREIPSVMVGEMAMEALKDLDEVAYIRFASVYRQFKDINTFMKELKKLLGQGTN